MEESDIRIGIEKRKYVRLEVRLNARFQLVGDEGNHVYRAVTRNISHGGLCLEVADDVPDLLRMVDDHHARIMITLDLDDPPESVKSQATAVWVSTRVGWMEPPQRDGQPLLLGIAFEGMPDKERDRIATYVANKFIGLYRKS